ALVLQLLLQQRDVGDGLRRLDRAGADEVYGLGGGQLLDPAVRAAAGEPAPFKGSPDGVLVGEPTPAHLVEQGGRDNSVRLLEASVQGGQLTAAGVVALERGRQDGGLERLDVIGGGEMRVVSAHGDSPFLFRICNKSFRSFPPAVNSASAGIPRRRN